MCAIILLHYMLGLEQLTAGTLVKGIIPDATAELVSVKWHGSDVLEVVYKDSAGRVGTEILLRDREPSLQILTAGRPWSFDGDGRLDILLAGYNPTDGFLTRIYRNWATPAASPPPPPTDVTADVEGDVVTLSWTAPAAAKSAADGLTYNVRLGKTPGGGEICSGQVEATTGRRLVARPGNAGQSLSWSVQMPAGWTQLYGRV